MERSPLILLVEDDAAIRDAIAECLATEGYRVHAVGNGAEALAWLARAGRPDLIVLDFVMPVMNGAELLAQVRADPALGRVPTLLMTAAIVSSATPLPAADATLVKPFDLDELLGAVGRLVPRS